MSRRDETKRMANAAIETVGPALAIHLVGLPPDVAAEALLKLSCSLACMATAAHRQNQHIRNQSKSDFYTAAATMAASMLADILPPPRGEDYEVELAPDVKAEMAADPALKAGVTDALARMRQALDGVATGRFASVKEAMDSIGAEPLDLDDDDKGTLQ